MGTAGLSFGEATSGTGFDVSATVAEIVGNLQKVETPWNTQLTELESQDTAISSLGTLFSNLSSDMSSLTDIESTLNVDIPKENTLISAQQASLTAELNSANEIMQKIPTQLAKVNELYSAITGSNENTGG